MNKCFTQPYQRCTVGTSALLYMLLRTVRKAGPRNQSNHLSVLTGDVNAHALLSWWNCCCWTITPSFFFRSENTRCVLHIWASAIMQIMGTYLPECPWTTALNNYEDYVQCRKFAIQNNTYRSGGNCCRQIRLTLNVCFCAFGDILWGCLYNLIFTCKQ